MSLPSEDNARAIFINPFCTISFAEYLFKPSWATVAKEDWVLANTKLVEDMGKAEWLKQLLVTLTTEPNNLAHIAMNPSQVIKISQNLRGDHDPIVETALWIDANTKLMNELGVGGWLWELLGILEMDNEPLVG